MFIRDSREATLEESLEQLIRDIKLASFMGFTCMRTKLGVIDEILNLSLIHI